MTVLNVILFLSFWKRWKPSDFGQPAPLHQVVKAVNNRTSGCVDLVWNFGSVTPFPYVWLRDSCLCPDCFHPTTLSRSLRIDQLQVDIEPQSVQNDSAAQQLVVTWPDGHVSRYPHQWLRERSFAKRDVKARRKQLDGPKTVLWDRATMDRHLLHVDYDRLVGGDLATLHDALHHLIVYGLVLVRKAPTDFGAVEEIGETLGHVRPTHYGKTFRVASKVDANNLAYTANELAPHMDLTYYEYMPGVQMLHCISQHIGDGGESIFSDSFHVAEVIRARRPDLFHLLATVPFEFADIGEEAESRSRCRFHKIHERTMFCIDEDGNITQVATNNPVRSYRLNVPLELVKPMYEGLRMFNDLCRHPDNQLTFKMDNGDVAVFNNRRVTHGRLGFTVTEDSQRTLEGGYVDWDDIMCRYRIVTDLLRERP
ncbi:Gamma-butyrobetaine dioxygenase [Amphibalanus amphitrite]|uniref:Gamma-butyrobetaine dioxygenase n=1 Tax=Amphibalanus amphitrite TaxID=1232801 RepID=A0A6A4WDY6_AMPAM|nr:Gamma-butyrobetaine dioxygenase [Amphibalanus amphitrite]